MPNETIERIAEKLINHVQARVMKVGYCEDTDRPVFAAALSEMRTVALREAAEIAIGEKVDYESTRDDEDGAYNTACDHIAAAILGRIDK